MIITITLIKVKKNESIYPLWELISVHFIFKNDPTPHPSINSGKLEGGFWKKEIYT